MANKVNPDPGKKFDPGKSFLVKGSTLNRLLDAAMPVSAGKGLKEYETAKGKVLSLADVSELSAPFMPLIKREGITWKAALTPGKVVERLVKGDIALKYHEPSDLIDDNRPVWHAITPGKCLYVKCNVDKDGKITGTPAVSVGDDDMDGPHYKPEGFAFLGAEGEHNYKMFKFTIELDRPKMEIFNSGDDVHHYAERAKWKNREVDGDIRKIGDEYDPEDDIYWLKVIKQLPEGKPIIMPLQDGETPDGKKSIDFRGIREKDYEPQIRVKAEADDSVIVIEGNDKDGTLTHEPCEGEEGAILIEWRDGLIVTEGGISFVAGCSGSSGGGGTME
jgi:hypothetical protein